MKSRELLQNGVFTLSIFTIEKIDKYREKFSQVIKESPEFKSDAPVHNIGAFGAMGHPSSFHHPFFRKLRYKIYRKILPIFRRYSLLYSEAPIWPQKSSIKQDSFSQSSPEEKYHIQYLIDRISQRHPGTSLAAETWHRDNSTSDLIKIGDQIFGVMLNLSEESIKFSCVPGSHQTALAWYPGSFDKITIEEIEREDYNGRKKIFIIQPGEIIVFFQHIVHEIAKPKGKLRNTEYRIYGGIRLSLGNTDFFPKERIKNWITNQEVPQIKSGQTPDIYTKMHGVCFKQKAFHMAPGIRLSLEDWLNKTFKFPDQIFNRVHPSLKALNLPLHPEYQQEEIDILLPRPLFRNK